MTEPARERARDVGAAVAAGLDDARSRAATVGEPLVVRAADGSPESWFVPLVDGDELVAFVHLGLGLELRRSSFLRAPAASWLDHDTIRRTASQAVPAADAQRLGEPMLSFAASPDRLAWVVPVGDGEATVFVAGDHAWLAGPRRESTG